jgi:hypothetical protein
MRVIFRCDPLLAEHLPRPIPARSALPDWLRRMPATAFSPTHGGDIRTVKQCPPFVDAMTHGFVFLLPCDVHVANGVFSWDWPIPRPATYQHPRAPLSYHAPAQVEGAPFHTPDRIVVKFNSFWTVELPEGWSVFAMSPVNRTDLPFQLLSGLVDADRYHDVGILFPAIWTNPDFAGILPQGMPIAQCFPVKREALEYVFAPFDAQQQQAYDEVGKSLLEQKGVYRKHFRAPRSRPVFKDTAQDGKVEPEPSAGG